VADEARDPGPQALRRNRQLKGVLLDHVAARVVPQQLRMTEASDFLVQQLIHDRSFG
jgi:hypothetical protein